MLNGKTKNSVERGNGSMLGFEATLWAAADKLRGNVDAGEYKHVVLGLIFLKYISDAFEEQHGKLVKESGADPEDRDEYLALNISGCLSKLAGPTCKVGPNSRRSARTSTKPWSPSNAITRR